MLLQRMRETTKYRPARAADKAALVLLCTALESERTYQLYSSVYVNTNSNIKFTED